MNLDRRLIEQIERARGWFALTIVLGAIGGALVIAQASELSQVVASVFLRGARLGDVRAGLLLLIGIMFARAGIVWASEVSAFRIAARVKTDLHGRLADHLLRLGPAYVRGERTGDLLTAATEGIEALEAYYSQYLPQLALAALVPITILLFIAPIDLLSAVVLLVTGPLVPLFMILIGRAADALTRQQYTALSRMSAHFLDALQGLTTLKIFGRSREQISAIAQVSERFRDATMGVLRVAFLSAFALEMIATISTAVVAVEVGLRLLYGQLQFEPAFFILVLAPEYYLPLRQLGARFHAAMSGAAAGARLFEILGAEAKTPDPGPPAPSTGACSRPPRVEFRDVHYAYDGDRAALEGVSLVLEPGERAALIGPTGAGKSTVVSLLLRFISPDAGSIEIDGVPLERLSARAWLQNVAWVPQDPYLFDASVADNIRLARPGASTGDLVRAATLADAHDFIRTMPQGYDTRVGERGARLSAGQAQRIAIARAFLKDAPFMILDEATSNLDVASQARIQDTIERLLLGRTCLIVSHRLRTVQGADQIIVLSRGRVAESGAHASLMGAHGPYYRLVSAAFVDGVADVKPPVRRQSQETMPLQERPVSTRTPAAGGAPRAETAGGLRSSLDTLFRLLRLAAPFKWLIGLAVVLGSLTIGSGMGLMATAAYIIASAALHPSIADLAVPIVGVRFFGIARGAFRYLERYVSHDVNLSLLARLRVWLYSSIEPLAPARLAQASRHSGDLVSAIVGDVETLENLYVRVLAPPLVALVVAAAMFAYLAGYSVEIAVVVLAFMALAGIAVPVAARRLSASAGRRLVDVRAELSVRWVDTIQGMADLVAFGRAADQAADLRRLYRERIQLQARLAAVAGLSGAAGSLLTNGAAWCALVLATGLIVVGRLDGVFLPVIALAVLASFEGALALSPAFQYLETNMQAARRLFKIADAGGAATPRAELGGARTRAPLQFQAPERPEVHREACGTRRDREPCGVVVRNLSFRYAPGETLVLDQVSFDLAPGRRLAVVGPSGAGKTTLVNLLLRFWDPAPGQIFVGGRDLTEYTPDQARALFGVVPQPVHLFNRSIRSNLQLARPDVTDEEIEDAARQAQVHEFISHLPDGYATIAGEHGMQLSGGERQRVAIARALLNRAPILLLDEPTANLDPLTERDVLAAIRTLAAERTLLMITHRLVGLERFDEILVLQAGRVVERGRHADLLRTGGWYREMWDEQNHSALLERALQ